MVLFMAFVQESKGKRALKKTLLGFYWALLSFYRALFNFDKALLSVHSAHMMLLSIAFVQESKGKRALTKACDDRGVRLGECVYGGAVQVNSY